MQGKDRFWARVCTILAATAVPMSAALAQDTAGSAAPAASALFGDPESIEERLQQDAPSRRAVFRGYNAALQPWYKWKDHLSDKYGLDFTISLTTVYQAASETLTGTDDSSGYDFDISGTWVVAGRGTSSPSTLGFQFLRRDDLGTDLTPQVLFTQYGGLYSSGAPYGEREFSVAQFYWQQRFGDNFGFQIGRIFPISNYDFFPLKNFRTDFLDFHGSTNLTIPLPDYGLGGFVRYKPSDRVRLTFGIHDANAFVEESGLDTWDGETFKIAEMMVDLEQGQRPPGRPPASYVNFSLWQVDERTDAQVDDGWGVAVTAFQRMDNFAVFGRLGWADVEETGVLASPTPARLAATLGFSIDGLIADFDDRLAMSFTFADPADRTLNDQKAIDAYYRVQLTPEIEFGPTLQVVIDPVNNALDDTVVVGGLRMRFVF